VSATATKSLRSFPPVKKNIETPETLSQTLLSKHNVCPRSAYLYRLYDGGPGSLELDRGVALHEAIERAERLMLDSGEVTIPEEMAREIAEAVMEDRTDLVLSASEQDRVRGMMWNWARSSFGTVDPETLLGIEMSMEVEISGFKCTCRLDRAEATGSTLVVIDYKSGFPGKQEDTDRSFQGQFYGMALLFGTLKDSDQNLGAGIDDVLFYEVFPRIRDEETGALFVREAVWSKHELYEFKTSLERNILAFETSLETGDWPARDGSWCGRCPAPNECPIPANLRHVEQIETLEDAQDALSHKLALKREGERLQTGLREFFKQHGIVYVGDYAFDATVSQSRSVKDIPGLEAEVARATLAGQEVNEEPYIEERSSTKYAVRKLTKEERDNVDPS
jgi:hypothetical protein